MNEKKTSNPTHIKQQPKLVKTNYTYLKMQKPKMWIV